MKKYPKMKDSGLDLIGDTPFDWKNIKLKYACKINPSKSELKNLSNQMKVSFLPMELIGEDGSLDLGEERELNEVKDRFTYFKNNDVIIAKITPCFENGKGSLCKNLKNGIGLGTTELHVLRPDSDFDSLYTFYWTRSHPFMETGESLMYGAAGQKRVPTKFIKDFVISYPKSMREQNQIGKFLKTEIDKINFELLKNQKLLELLEKKKQAIINQSVTKGIDLSVEMKNSGIDWIEDIPKNWEIKKLNFTIELMTEYASNGSFAGLRDNVNYLGEPDYARLIRLTDLRKNISNESGIWIDQSSYEFLKKSKLFGREILMANVGAYAGTFFRMPKISENASLAPNMILIKFKSDQIMSDFFMYASTSLHIFDQLKQLSSLTTAQPKIDKTGLKQIKIIRPTITDQKLIINYLNIEIPKINSLIIKIKFQIEKFEELIKSLMYSAVTGKIDVRGTIT